MIIIKKPDELAAMRVSAKKTATILHKVAAKVAPGVTTGELDDYAAELARKEEGRCAFYGYHGFSGRICCSINEEVVHGVPGKRIIRDGDVVSIDFGLVYGGFVGDTATTVAVGHGIGREMHEDPQIPNYGPKGRGPVLKAGMTFAIEPMINLGVHKTETLKDGWTVVTKDRLPSAHFEHTIAVGRDKAEILTIPDPE
jgi:methionyl aminopeptidase